LTESDSLRKSDTEAKPRIFSESDFKFNKPEEVMYHRLTPEGTLKGSEPDLSPQLLKKFYEQMVFGRHFDEKATNLSTLREIGTYAPCKGQEGAQVGFVLPLSKRDW
jgi:pyruvate dehydrogenase E1 component alpha subunit